jgi:hypothetical protein
LAGCFFTASNREEKNSCFMTWTVQRSNSLAAFLLKQLPFPLESEPSYRRLLKLSREREKVSPAWKRSARRAKIFQLWEKKFQLNFYARINVRVQVKEVLKSSGSNCFEKKFQKH